jgi:(R,R)-butanediol dehydrogenase / meso-butanediol dehydrogenase / diacetyl reductase
MEAARFYGKEDIRIEDIPEPSPGPNEVKLRNAYTGVCGTDLHVFFTPEASGFDFSTPDELTGATLPQVFGHEFSGEVVDVGESVTDYQKGDRVAVWPLHSCGSCVACAGGLDQACQRLACQGITSPGGGMSTFTVVQSDKLFKLPESVDLRMGALVEPMASSWHAVARSGIEAGQTALIAGAGPIGIGVWFALKAHGVDRIVVSEPRADRRDAIASLGAESVVSPEDDLSAAVASATDGKGVDVAFDAAGIGSAVHQAIASLTPQGTLLIVALHEQEFGFNPTPFVFAENTMVGSIAYRPEDFDAVIQAMAENQYNFEGWVTDVPLEGVGDALRDLRSGRGIKILVKS